MPLPRFSSTFNLPAIGAAVDNHFASQDQRKLSDLSMQLKQLQLAEAQKGPEELTDFREIMPGLFGQGVVGRNNQWRNVTKMEQKGGPGYSVKQLADGYNYWVPDNPGTAPIRVSPDLVAPSGMSEDDLRDYETTLRGEYTKEVKPYKVQTDAYNRIVASAEQPSPAGDMALLFNYMKVLDPGSTVREGEFATVGSLGGLPNQVQAMFNKLSGEGLLSDAQRRDVVKRSGLLYQKAIDSKGIVDERYKSLATAAKANHENILYDFTTDIYTMPQATQPPPLLAKPDEPVAQPTIDDLINRYGS